MCHPQSQDRMVTTAVTLYALNWFPCLLPARPLWSHHVREYCANVRPCWSNIRLSSSPLKHKYRPQMHSSKAAAAAAAATRWVFEGHSVWCCRRQALQEEERCHTVLAVSQQRGQGHQGLAGYKGREAERTKLSFCPTKNAATSEAWRGKRCLCFLHRGTLWLLACSLGK